MRVEASITAKRPIGEAFAALSDWTNSSTWISGTQSVTKTSAGEIGVGTVWHTVGKLVGRAIEADVTVTEFEPDHRFAWVVDRPFKATATWTLAAVEGGTRVNQTIDAELEGFLRLARPVLLPMMRRQVQNDLDTFRDLMDAQTL